MVLWHGYFGEHKVNKAVLLRDIAINSSVEVGSAQFKGNFGAVLVADIGHISDQNIGKK